MPRRSKNPAVKEKKKPPKKNKKKKSPNDYNGPEFDSDRYRTFHAEVHCECGNFIADVYVVEDKGDPEVIHKYATSQRLKHIYGSPPRSGSCMVCGLPDGVQPQGVPMSHKESIVRSALEGMDAQPLIHHDDALERDVNLSGRYRALKVDPLDAPSVFRFFKVLHAQSAQKDTVDWLWTVLIRSFEDLFIRESAMLSVLADLQTGVLEHEWPMDEQFQNGLDRLSKLLDKRTVFSTTGMLNALRDEGLDDKLARQVLEALDGPS